MIDSAAIHATEAAAVSTAGFKDYEPTATSVGPYQRALDGRDADGASQSSVLHAVPEILDLMRGVSASSSAREGSEVLARQLHDRLNAIVLIEDVSGTTRHVVPTSASSDLAAPDWRRSPHVEHARATREGNWLIAAAKAHEVSLGAICIFDPANQLGVDAACLVEAAAAVAGFLLFKDIAVAEMEAKVWADFASELLDNPARASVRRHAATLGHTLEPTHRVVAIDLAGYRAGAVEAAVRRVAPRFLMTDLLLTTRESHLLLLVWQDVDWSHFGAMLAQELETPPRIGVGRARSVELIQESLGEAELALRMSSTGVVEVDDLGVLGLLAADADPSRLLRLVDRWIGTLVSYDAAHHGELVATLGAYLQSHGGIETTARTLYVHSSTVKYRIRRISELLRVDLSDSETWFNLDLACRAQHVLERLARKTPQ